MYLFVEICKNNMNSKLGFDVGFRNPRTMGCTQRDEPAQCAWTAFTQTPGEEVSYTFMGTVTTAVQNYTTECLGGAVASGSNFFFHVWQTNRRITIFLIKL